MVFLVFFRASRPLWCQPPLFSRWKRLHKLLDESAAGLYNPFEPMHRAVEKETLRVLKDSFKAIPPRQNHKRQRGPSADLSMGLISLIETCIPKLPMDGLVAVADSTTTITRSDSPLAAPLRDALFAALVARVNALPDSLNALPDAEAQPAAVARLIVLLGAATGHLLRFSEVIFGRVDGHCNESSSAGVVLALSQYSALTRQPPFGVCTDADDPALEGREYIFEKDTGDSLRRSIADVVEHCTSLLAVKDATGQPLQLDRLPHAYCLSPSEPQNEQPVDLFRPLLILNAVACEALRGDVPLGLLAPFISAIVTPARKYHVRLANSAATDSLRVELSLEGWEHVLLLCQVLEHQRAAVDSLLQRINSLRRAERHSRAGEARTLQKLIGEAFQCICVRMLQAFDPNTRTFSDPLVRDSPPVDIFVAIVDLLVPHISPLQAQSCGSNFLRLCPRLSRIGVLEQPGKLGVRWLHISSVRNRGGLPPSWVEASETVSLQSLVTVCRRATALGLATDGKSTFCLSLVRLISSVTLGTPTPQHLSVIVAFLNGIWKRVPFEVSRSAVSTFSPSINSLLSDSSHASAIERAAFVWCIARSGVSDKLWSPEDEILAKLISRETFSSVLNSVVRMRVTNSKVWDKVAYFMMTEGDYITSSLPLLVSVVNSILSAELLQLAPPDIPLMDASFLSKVLDVFSSTNWSKIPPAITNGVSKQISWIFALCGTLVRLQMDIPEAVNMVPRSLRGLHLPQRDPPFSPRIPLSHPQGIFEREVISSLERHYSNSNESLMHDTGTQTTLRLERPRYISKMCFENIMVVNLDRTPVAVLPVSESLQLQNADLDGFTAAKVAFIEKYCNLRVAVVFGSRWPSHARTSVGPVDLDVKAKCDRLVVDAIRRATMDAPFINEPLFARLGVLRGFNLPFGQEGIDHPDRPMSVGQLGRTTY